ncbi:uncharacterized protein LOC127572922 [Pristis pectinata]|uniref:uncharacterized protein LOC127572922 n=1 Tax=Pristis pectinata TaxID=685728 RepID=UPI00223DC002|nr:uncharacterized protein LOC127572922 [Pristis pectinata]
MYRMVTEFKDSIINFFLGKEMIPAAQAFQEIAVVRYCPDVDILAQVRLMASSSQCILNEVLTVISALLSTDGMEYPESSFGWLTHEKATINIGSALHDKASLKSLQDFGKSANSTVSVDCAKGPSQTELRNKLQLLQQQCDDVIQCNDKRQHQNKQQIDKRKIHISCLQRELDAIHHANASQCTRRDMKFDKARDPDAILLFTRADMNHNTRVLTKGVNNNIISKENYKNAVRTMEQYIDLQKVRFSQLVKQYSQHVTLKEAEKCINHQVVTTKPISEVFKKMKELYIKQIVSLTRSYYEKLQDLTPHYNKNPGSVENYIKGLWKMQVDNPESATLCKTILFTTPKLLEMEFKKNGIAQRNVSCRLPQLALRDDGRKDLAYNKLQSHFTEKNSSSLHHCKGASKKMKVGDFIAQMFEHSATMAVKTFY